MRPVGHKFCTKCEKYLDYKNFSLCKRVGLQPKCKSCNKVYRESKKEAIASYQRKRYLEQPESYKLANIKRRALNPSGVRKNIKDYKTRKKFALPSWLTKEQHKQIENFYWLAEDLKRTSGEVYHVDHIVPLQGKNVCGLHVPWNLQILPADLNLRKSNKYDLSGGAR
jgi:hypothetical protein